MRMTSKYDLIHAHHPIAALAMKELFPETPVIMTIHSSFERELLLNGRIEENGPEQAFLISIYGELEYKLDQILTVSNAFKKNICPSICRIPTGSESFLTVSTREDSGLSSTIIP